MLKTTPVHNLRLRARKAVYPLIGFIIMPLVLAACQYPYDGSLPFPVQTAPRPVVEAASQESVLPPRLKNAEDVFKALGVWNDASELLEDGLTPQQVARDLGFGPDKMHRHLLEAGEEAFERYNRQSAKWVEELFPFNDAPPIVVNPIDADEVLPRLRTHEDVFRALDTWPKAVRLIESGLPLWKVARELELGPDRMQERLMKVAEKRVKNAIESGRLGPYRGEDMLDDYEQRVEKWIDEIFEDEQPIVKPIELDDLLPEIDSAKDVFKALGVWDEAKDYIDDGLSLEHTSRELGFTEGSMHEHLMTLARQIARQAINANRIDSRVADELVEEYNHVALEWVEIIFADKEPEIIEVEPVDIYRILPRLQSAEDVFKFLDEWDDAEEYLDRGFSLEHTAREVGFDSVREMQEDIVKEAEDLLEDAEDDGLITESLVRIYLGEYKSLALEWVDIIFADKEPDIDPNDVLPKLNTVDDVFRTLGKWPQFKDFREEGLTVREAAVELGFTSDSLEDRLEDIGEDEVDEAVEIHGLSERVADDLMDDYEDLIEEWAEEIFSRAPESPAISLVELLPRFESIEDVFRTLGVWDDASFLMDEDDLSAEDAARELDYTPNWMEDLLFGVGEEIVEDILENDLIGDEVADDLLNDYEDYVEHWVEEIFGDY